MTEQKARWQKASVSPAGPIREALSAVRQALVGLRAHSEELRAQAKIEEARQAAEKSNG